MNPSSENFAESYRSLSDEEIAALRSDTDSLTDEARVALLAEIQQRGLSDEEMRKLHSTELRHEAQFDRLERFRRKRMVVKELGLNDPKGWIIAIVGLGLLILIEKLVSSHH